MRAVSIFAIVASIGIIVLVYVLTSQSSLNWDRLKQDYKIDNQTTQKEVTDYIGTIYSQGSLVTYLKVESIIALGAGIFLSLGGIIVVFHLIIDKLFFCKYYQHPDLLRAMIRGVLWASFPLVIIYLGIWHYLTPEITLLAVVLYIILEFLTQSIYRKFRPVQKPENANEQTEVSPAL